MLRGLGVGSHEHVVPVGEVGAGRPYLLAGDDEIIAVLHTTRGKGCQVRPCIRFGKALRPVDGVVAHPVQECVFHPVRAVNHDRPGNVGLRLRGRRVVIGHLLRVDELAGDRRILSAVLLRPRHRPPAAINQLLLEVLRVVAGARIVIVIRPHVHRVGVVVLGVPLLGKKLAQLGSESLIGGVR